MRMLIGAAGVLAAAWPAVAEPAASGQAGEVVVHGRKPVVVTAATCPDPDPAKYPASRPPRVVDSYPRQGAATPPGYVRVRVTFDAPMTCQSEMMFDGPPPSGCAPAGSWDLPARQSWSTECRLQPGTEFYLKFRKIDGSGFVGRSGLPAEPFELDFRTSDAPPTASAEAAARLDPGPPDRPASYGYVTCTDSKGAAQRDCLRDLSPPAPPLAQP